MAITNRWEKLHATNKCRFICRVSMSNTFRYLSKAGEWREKRISVVIGIDFQIIITLWDAHSVRPVTPLHLEQYSVIPSCLLFGIYIIVNEMILNQWWNMEYTLRGCGKRPPFCRWHFQYITSPLQLNINIIFAGYRPTSLLESVLFLSELE